MNMENAEILQAILGEITGIKGEISGIKGEIKGMNQRMDNMEKQMTVMQEDIAEIKEFASINRTAVNSLVEWTELASRALKIPYPIKDVG
jgi:uncharacterized coiled-coil DUF342 family protein